jgi:hypothetical protein
MLLTVPYTFTEALFSADGGNFLGPPSGAGLGCAVGSNGNSDASIVVVEYTTLKLGSTGVTRTVERIVVVLVPRELLGGFVAVTTDVIVDARTRSGLVPVPVLSLSLSTSEIIGLAQ